MSKSKAIDRVQFASDNYSGACPEAWKAMALGNLGFARSYGDDPWTARAADAIRRVFDHDCEVFFVLTGTAANSLALASLCRSYHSVICHALAHIETDECGGPEFFSNGTKILHVEGEQGKLDIVKARHAITRRTDIHYPKPRVISLTQSTELGTVYTVDELKAVGKLARQYGLKVHMDGSRFANAVAALKVHPSEISWKAGVDVLCFGGAKNGLLCGEAVVFFNKALAAEFDYRCKQAGQLVSKMRFLTAPWAGLLESGAWLIQAQHGNAMVKRLAKGLEDVPGVNLIRPFDVNALFVDMPDKLAQKLKAKGWVFYNFIGTGHHRFMCNWATKPAAVDALVADFRALA